jgi:hypothetical protein
VHDEHSVIDIGRSSLQLTSAFAGRSQLRMTMAM